MRIDLTRIRAIAEELAAYRDDEETYIDTLDGETDAVELLDREIAAEQADRALCEAIKAQMEALRKRADRIDMRADTRRRMQKAILEAMGLRKLERPLATLSIRLGSVSVKITDDAAIPTQLRTVKTTSTPDKIAIRKQLDAGETVPGAELVRGDETLSVRVA